MVPRARIELAHKSRHSLPKCRVDRCGVTVVSTVKTTVSSRVRFSSAIGASIGYPHDMATVRVDIDQHTADVLETRAAELGVTVPELIAELAALDGSAREASADEIAELDARAARATSDTLVSQDHVVQWLRTWGTREYRPWPGR